MADADKIVIVDTDERFLKALEKTLVHQGLDVGAYVFCTSADGGDDTCVRFDDKPVRVGVVMDALLKASRAQNQPDVSPVLIGGWVFDGVQCVLIDQGDDQKTVKLTEKERDILQFLYGCGREGATREALLSAVWGYVEGVETHTMETHIYRLRQKIEIDPAAPLILLTMEDGYGLKI